MVYPKDQSNLVYSDLLSQERAEEVTFYLASRGIAAGRMHYKGYGLRKPITTNLTQEGRRKNQRVDIKIIKYQILNCQITFALYDEYI